MKGLIIVTICVAFMIGIMGSEDCLERAKKVSVNMTECCIFPDIFDDKIIKEAAQKVRADGMATPATPLFDCLIEQTLYFDNKLADSKTGVIDKDACKKFITSNIKDKSWEKVIQAAFTKCSTEAIKYGEQYQIHTGIERETCDFKFDAISDCIDIASLSKCPKDSWTKKDDKKEPCEFLKNFITDCHKDISAIDEFLDHQND